MQEVELALAWKADVGESVLIECGFRKVRKHLFDWRECGGLL